MKQPYFSIIIPALNEEKYIPKLLDDLDKQTFKDFEAIVVDGNSVDQTFEKCSNFQNKLELKIISTKKRNVSFQRNLGASRARSEWIIFMDADNRLPEYFLEGVKYRILKEKPDAFTTYCSPDSNKGSDEALVKFINLGMEINNIIESPSTWGSMIGVRKFIFNKGKGFDEKIGFAEDTEYVKRIYNKGIKFCVFRDPRYVVSLRHFRRDGKLKYLGNTAKLHLKNLAGIRIDQSKEYPMGGEYEDGKDLNGLTAFFNDFKKALKKPKILLKINKYLAYLEGDY